MSGVYGTVVWFYEEKNQILVRFGATQQMYFAPDELKRWGGWRRRGWNRRSSGQSWSHSVE
ncbi:hypothetical protein CH282_02050 [Rhodococcus sp. 06-418-1B]|nr:hypothetical protein CH282_02050 [Rhodococcus sp. 06-418-1B]